jgi:sigma-B regulation protein RsbU (phosphoserine phosphatase)
VLRWRAIDGAVERLAGDRLPLGFSPIETYDQQEYRLDPGDTILFYSDGLTEALNAKDEMFGIERLTHLIGQYARLGIHELLEHVRSAVAQHICRDCVTDDLTCVAVKIDSLPNSSMLPIHKMTVRSRLEELPGLRKTIARLCAPFLDEVRLNRLLLAANEAASNIIKHAYHGRHDRTFDVHFAVYPKRIQLSLYHSGEPFNRSNAVQPIFNGSHESGFGVYIMETCVDEVRYEHNASGISCISLVINKDAHA